MDKNRVSVSLAAVTTDGCISIFFHLPWCLHWCSHRSPSLLSPRVHWPELWRFKHIFSMKNSHFIHHREQSANVTNTNTFWLTLTDSAVKSFHLCTWFLRTQPSGSRKHMCSPGRNQRTASLNTTAHAAFKWTWRSHGPPGFSSVSTCLLCRCTGPWTSAPPGPALHPDRQKTDTVSQRRSRGRGAEGRSERTYLRVDDVNDDILVCTQLEGLCYSLVHTDRLCVTTTCSSAVRQSYHFTHVDEHQREPTCNSVTTDTVERHINTQRQQAWKHQGQRSPANTFSFTVLFLNTAQKPGKSSGSDWSKHSDPASARVSEQGSDLDQPRNREKLS